MYTLQVKDLEVIFGLRMFVSSFFLSQFFFPFFSQLKLQFTVSFQELTGQFHFPVETSGTFHGFTAWFAVYFESLEAGGTTVELNTGPNAA